MKKKLTILMADYPLFKATIGSLLPYLAKQDIECGLIIIVRPKSLLRRFLVASSKSIAIRKAVARTLLSPPGRSSIAMNFNDYLSMVGVEKIARETAQFEKFVSQNSDKVLLCDDINSTEVLERLELERATLGYLEGAGILRDSLLSKFSDGVLNCHGGGFLPRYRGLGSLEMSLIDGRALGLNFHYIDCGIDTGDLIHQEQLDLSKIQSLGRLYAYLFIESRPIIARVLKSMIEGSMKRVPQNSGRLHYMVHPIIETYAERILQKSSDISLPEILN